MTTRSWYFKIFLNFGLEPLVNDSNNRISFNLITVRWKKCIGVCFPRFLHLASRKVNRFIEFTLPLDNAWQRERRVHSSQLIGSMTAFDKRYQMTRSAFCFFSPPPLSLFLVIHRVTSIRNLLSDAANLLFTLDAKYLFSTPGPRITSIPFS